jgi:hypothetical protein
VCSQVLQGPFYYYIIRLNLPTCHPTYQCCQDSSLAYHIYQTHELLCTSCTSVVLRRRAIGRDSFAEIGQNEVPGQGPSLADAMAAARFGPAEHSLE